MPTQTETIATLRVTPAGIANALKDTVSLLGGGAALPESLRKCCQAWVEQLGVTFAGVWTLHVIEDVLQLDAFAGGTAAVQPSGRAPLARDRLSRAVRERRGQSSPDIMADPSA